MYSRKPSLVTDAYRRTCFDSISPLLRLANTVRNQDFIHVLDDYPHFNDLQYVFKITTESLSQSIKKSLLEWWFGAYGRRSSLCNSPQNKFLHADLSIIFLDFFLSYFTLNNDWIFIWMILLSRDIIYHQKY